MPSDTRIAFGGLVITSAIGPDGGHIIPAAAVLNGPPQPEEFVVEIDLPSGHGERLTTANAVKLRDALTEALR